MARLDGNLNVTGNISAANYPPKISDLAATEEHAWEVTTEGQRVFTILHGFGSRFLEVILYDKDTYKQAFAAVTFPEPGTVEVCFAEPPKIGRKFLIVIIDNGNE